MRNRDTRGMEMGQPLRKTIQQFLQRFGKELPCDPGSLFLGCISKRRENTTTHKKTKKAA